MELSLVTYPHPVLKKKAAPVNPLASETQEIVKSLIERIEEWEAFGFNAPMFGLSQQIMAVRLTREDPNILVILNPNILDESVERQEYAEGSPSFPGIQAVISRPRRIKLSYQDLQGLTQEIEVEDFLATVIQHQMDNLQGKNFLDHLSSLKKQMLLKKMDQAKKEALKGHVHGPHCQHD